MSFACLSAIIFETLKKYQPLWLAIIASIVVVLNPLTISVFGGEAPLYLFLAVSSCVAFLAQRNILCGICIGLALMCRTEAVILLGTICIYSYIVNKKIPSSVVAIAILTAAPWIIYATTTFGSPLSLSFTAKVAQVSAGRYPFPFGCLSYLYNLIVRFPALALCLPITIVGIAKLRNAPSSILLILTWATVQSFSYALLPIPFYHWYAPQIGIAIVLLTAFGIQQFLSKQNSVRKYLVCFSAIAAALSIMSAYIFQNEIGNNASNKLYRNVGTWLSGNSAPDSKIAFFEVGQIAYYSNREIIDTLGLVTSQVASHVAVNDWLWVYKKYQPEYIISDRVYRSIFDQYHNQLEGAEWFKQDYSEVARFDDVRSNTPLIIFKKTPNFIIPNP